MRILFFSDNFVPEPSAPAAHVYERARIWAEEGHEVTVVTSAPNMPFGRVYPGYRNVPRRVEVMDGVRVVRVMTYIAENKGVTRRSLDYLSYGVSSFLNALLERRPDVVLSTSPHLFAPLAGILYSGLRRVPHVMEVRDLWPASIAATTGLRTDSKVYRWLERLELFLYRQSTGIIAFTNSFVEDLQGRGVPSDKIRVVLNGANLSLFAPCNKNKDVLDRYGLHGRFVVGYLGTLGLAHGLENVIDAAEILRNEDVTFFFVGEGATKAKLSDEVKRRQLPNVVFASRQEKKDMPQFWSACDASLVHLRNDPVFETVVPSKIFEAMAMGLPTVYVGPKGEGSGIVTSREAGIAVPPANPAELAASIRLLKTDTALRSRLAANSLKAAPDFSRVKQAAATIRFLKEACRRWSEKLPGQRERRPLLDPKIGLAPQQTHQDSK